MHVLLASDRGRDAGEKKAIELVTRLESMVIMNSVQTTTSMLMGIVSVRHREVPSAYPYCRSVSKLGRD